MTLRALLLTIQLQIVLIILLLSFMGHARHIAPTIAYVSFSSLINSDYLFDAPTKLLEDVLHADDSPYQRVDLPFPFNFFGRNLYHIYVGPNGLIQDIGTQPCRCGCFYDVPSCTFNNSYQGAIAGYLTDLDPSASGTSGKITIAVNPDYARVHYEDIPKFGVSYPTFSFFITLFSDGRVIIEYTQIYPTKLLISGLRAPKFNVDFNTVYSASQNQIGLNDWQTSAPGIYPSRSNVLSGRSFNICPISTSWCINQTDITPNSGNIFLRPLSISCVDMLNFAISVTQEPLTFQPSDAEMANILSPTCEYLPLESSFSCDQSQFFSESNPSSYFVSIFWQPKNSLQPISDQNFNFLNVKSIPIVYSGISLPGTSNCATSTPYQGCNNCTVCSGDLTCFNLTCDLSQPILYKYPECPNNCSTDNIYNAATSTCCTVDQQDCNGVCFGGAKVADSGTGSKICCEGKVDCFGVCGGTAFRDGCGRCGGLDYKGRNCDHAFRIDTGSPDGNFYPGILLSSENSLKIVYVNVSNSNVTSVNVRLSLMSSNKASMDPLISFPSNTTLVAGNSSILIPITVSLWRLIHDEDVLWESKKLFVTYERSSHSDVEYNFEVTINSFILGCGTVSSQTSCMKFPGCIYCVQYPGMRTLSLQSVDNKSLETTGNQSIFRKLFADLLPVAWTPDFRSDNFEGVCIEGLKTSDCSPLAMSSAQPSYTCLILYLYTSTLLIVTAIIWQ